ncbi:MAG: anhydro-N-acetylmuramic acid kinase [Flavobacteriales bacterium]
MKETEKCSYRAIGLMSGTSLDGLDMACCDLLFDKGSWDFRILHTKTIDYNKSWLERLKNLSVSEHEKLHRTDVAYGNYIGQAVRKFLSDHQIKDVRLIASHGHTVAHRPDVGLTLQIGNGQKIADITDCTVVCDFRKADVALGGQGAPLVPVGDELLFSEYAFCLNLGGFANISFRDRSGIRRALDICPVNLALNLLASEHCNALYDDCGHIAASGSVHPELLSALNSLEFYSRKPPKSLGKEWFDAVFVRALSTYDIPLPDKLATVCRHIAIQIANVVYDANKGVVSRMIISGGGAYNRHLISEIEKISGVDIVIPTEEIINFREALIFALLGVLKLRSEVNSLASVTGASADSSSGEIFHPAVAR